MGAVSNCRLIGRWRLVEADLWDRESLDLCGPARLAITAQGGEIAFGALEAGPRSRIRPRTRSAFVGPVATKADQVEGEGDAELLDDGAIQIQFSYRNGDEAILKAKPDPSSTSCYGNCRVPHAKTFRFANSARTLGATTVPRSSIERRIAACGRSPTAICMR